MVSSNGRWIITYNGEIYNFKALRVELAASGVQFRGTSDTEVLLEGIAHWGVVPALQRCRGMFAFGLWDRNLRRLILARDRLGEKPLYYGAFGESVVFASELKSIVRHPGFTPTLDEEAVAGFFRYGYIPAPRTIYRGISKLPAAHVCEIDAATGAMQVDAYWRLPPPDSGHFTDGDAVKVLEERLSASIELQSFADVPVGAFLSGGIDSSTVVSLMAASGADVRTFTIGFHESGYDEAKHARAIAKHLRTNHTELYVTPSEAMSVIPHLPDVYDEPFADPSQIPTYLISRLAREHVTVALSGDGGDELFGGYERYRRLEAVLRWGGRIPGLFRPVVSAGLGVVPGRVWDGVLPAVWRARGGAESMSPSGSTVQKLRGMFEARLDPAHAHDSLMVQWTEPPLLSGPHSAPRAYAAAWHERGSATASAAYADTLVYLPDDILVKVDRASMAHSLEARAPLLDHELVEWIHTLPLEVRFGGPEPKWLLRQVLYRHVPASLVDRPKRGFGVPVGDWVRGPLRNWAEDLLTEDRVRDGGLLDYAAARQVWEEHSSGRRDHSARVWSLLMFQAWMDRWTS